LRSSIRASRGSGGGVSVIGAGVGAYNVVTRPPRGPEQGEEQVFQVVALRAELGQHGPRTRCDAPHLLGLGVGLQGAVGGHQGLPPGRPQGVGQDRYVDGPDQGRPGGPQLLGGPVRDDPPVVDDDEMVGDDLDLAQQVRGEQHGAAIAAGHGVLSPAVTRPLLDLVQDASAGGRPRSRSWCGVRAGPDGCASNVGVCGAVEAGQPAPLPTAAVSA
jgi:hypothetical protein